MGTVTTNLRDNPFGPASSVPLVDGSPATGISLLYARQDHVHPTDSALTAALALKAPIDSPTFTGTPAAPTAAPGTNTTQLATAAFVQAAVTALINGAPGALDTLKELADAINDDASYAATITGLLALKAPLASPTLTGVPTAPTAAVGTSTTQLATTAFVDAEAVAKAGDTMTGTLNGTSFAASGNLTGLGAVLTNTAAGGANLQLSGNGGTTPNKYMRASSGVFEVLNNAYSVAILSLTDAGELSWPGSAWTAYTPTVTVSGGGAGTATGRYKLLGKTMAIQVTVNVTTGGTAASFTLPGGITSGGAIQYLAGRENAVNGFMFNGLVGSGATAVNLNRYDNNQPVTAGWNITVSGTIEIA